MWTSSRSSTGNERREIKAKNNGGLVAVAIDKDKKNSHSALKWAIDHLLQKGQTLILIHVKAKSINSPLPTTKGNQKIETDCDLPIVCKDPDPRTKDIFLPFRCLCTCKDMSSKGRNDRDDSDERRKRIDPNEKRRQKRPVSPKKKKYGYAQKAVMINEERASRLQESSSDDEFFVQTIPGAVPETEPQANSPDPVPQVSTGSRRRGDARAISPSGSATGMRRVFFVGESLLGENGLSGFFRPQIRNHLDGFYPRWSDVPIDTKSAIWESFKKEWSLEGHNPSFVYSKFLNQCGVQYRKFISEMKSKQMTIHGCKDVTELINKPRPAFMKSDDVWQQFVRHWNSPEQIARSQINTRNRKLREGCSHGFGRKSAAARLHEMAEQGKKPSMLSVMMDVNQKRDKKNNPTGEVHHRELQAAIKDYSERYVCSHGSDKNPLEEEMDMTMWRTTSEVARRTRQGRVLGMGSSTHTSTWKSPEASSSSGTTYDALSRMEERMKKEQEEMRKNHQDEIRRIEEARAQEMNKMMLNQQGLESQFAQLLKTMSQLVPNFPASHMTPQPFFPPPTGGSSAASHPEVFVQTQGVPQTQHNPSDDEDEDDDDEE